MAKTMFIGDLHINEKSPMSRKEDNEEYRQLALSKLKFCFDTAMGMGIENIIFAGDIFNNSTDLLLSYKNEFIKLLKSYSYLTYYTIIGNHDLYFSNQEAFEKTLLYMFFISGIMKSLSAEPIFTGKCYITGVDYKQDIPEKEYRYSTYKNICVAHCFYENSFFGGEGNTNLTANKAKELGYNYYFLGHDHSYYGITKENDFSIIRPGSLMRGTSKTDNLYRDVKIAVYDDTLDNWEEISVPIKDGMEVFLEKKIIEKQQLDINLSNIISNLYSSSNMSTYDVIDGDRKHGEAELGKIYPKVIDLLTHYLESEGVYRSSQ